MMRIAADDSTFGRVIMVLAAATLQIANSSVVKAGGSAPIGGPGGVHVVRSCPAGQWLAGFDARIDATQMSHAGPLCVPLDVSGRWRDGPKPIGTQDLDVRGADGRMRVDHGGTLGFGTTGDGREHRAVCPTDFLVTGLAGALRVRDGTLARVHLLCSAGDGREVKVSMPEDLVGPPTAFAAMAEVRCPSREAAMGVTGGSSRVVDRLALDCARPPRLTDRMGTETKARTAGEVPAVPAERRQGSPDARPARPPG